jgi:hypothetical protein
MASKDSNITYSRIMKQSATNSLSDRRLPMNSIEIDASLFLLEESNNYYSYSLDQKVNYFVLTFSYEYSVLNYLHLLKLGSGHTFINLNIALIE